MSSSASATNSNNDDGEQQQHQQQSSNNQNNNNNYPVFTKPKLLLLFDHRSVFDMTDADYLEIAGWEEALGSFGVENLTRETFFENMSQKGEADVMKNMCPFTTRLEWDSFLTKKRQKMNHELEDWCFANCVPIPGFTKFVEACQREFDDNTASVTSSTATKKGIDGNDDDKTDTSTTTTTIHTPDCLSMWLTPWRLQQAQTVLKINSLNSHVSPSIVDGSAFSIVDALEVFGLRPPVETPAFLEQLATYRLAETTRTVQDLVRNRDETLEKTFSSALNEQSSSSSSPPTKVIVFTNSSTVAKQARNLGLVAVGVSYNSYDQEEDEKVLLKGCDNEAALLEAGCRIVVPDYSKMLPQYLRML